VHWVAGGLAPHNLPIFTAAVPVMVSRVIGRVEIPSSRPATLSLVKVIDGEGMSLAPPIAASLNVAGTAFTNQSLALVEDISILMLDPGDSIGVQTTGSYAAAAGGITVHLIPLE
jgi:hypothetical protein